MEPAQVNMVAASRVEKRAVQTTDITMVLCIRAHAGNPWLLQRLEWMAAHYVPCPPVVIVDFGSAPDYAAPIARLCERHDYALVVVDDTGVFSLARARNIGFQHVETDFVFFCDPDFFGERDLFLRMAQLAGSLDMRSVVDIVLDMPAVHLSQEQSRQFEEAAPDLRSTLLRRWAWTRNYDAFDKTTDSYIAPYSNVFMIHRAMFSMAGGYDESFRGHGSEDFEFLLRLAMHASYLPLPASHAQDVYSPHSEEFFEARPYAGFRRLFELMAQPTESVGLKVFHLWHERERQSEWYRNIDRGRNRFKAAISRYVDAPQALLGIDHLARSARLLCCCPDPADWTLFVPLRLVGFQLQPIFACDARALAALPQALLDGQVDGVALLQPGSDTLASFADAPVLARKLGKRVVTIAAGAQPGSLHYGCGDVAQDFDRATACSTFTELPQASASPQQGMLRSVKAVTEFHWNGQTYALDRLGRTLPFGWQSYAAARIATRRTPEFLVRQVRRGLRACNPIDGALPALLRRWLKARLRRAGSA